LANNFDAIRLIAALAVMYGHGRYTFNLPDVQAWYRPESSLAVDVFFCVSGYLVTDSWRRQPIFSVYLTKRALRIFPAFILYVVVTMFVLGPLVTRVHLGSYFSQGETYKFLTQIALYPGFGFLPGVFVDSPSHGVVNGSLWTLPVEFFCYLCVPIVIAAPSKAREFLLVGIVLATGLWSSRQFLLHHTGSLSIYGVDIVFAVGETCYFASAALLRLLDERWPNSVRLDFALIGLVAVLGIEARAPGLTRPFSGLILPYIVIALGKTSTPVFRSAARFGDFSYGVYLWHFPILLTIAQMSSEANNQIWVDKAGIAVPIVFALAWLSWRLVERPALQLKRCAMNRQLSQPALGRAGWNALVLERSAPHSSLDGSQDRT
jgi:peptidoglycan/LPS O-acetylase OafA/YrhL